MLSTISSMMNPIANCRKQMTGRPHYALFAGGNPRHSHQEKGLSPRRTGKPFVLEFIPAQLAQRAQRVQRAKPAQRTYTTFFRLTVKLNK